MSTLLIITRLWEQATAIPGVNPSLWRQDFAGAWIRRDCYKRHTSCRGRENYGWDITYIHPLSQGGEDTIDNLRVIHWRNNECKGIDYPVFRTCITSEGNTNVYKIKTWKITKQKEKNAISWIPVLITNLKCIMIMMNCKIKQILKKIKNII